MTTAMQPNSVYGPLVAATDVEDAILEVLQKWIASYLFEIERQHSLEVGRLPVPRSWLTSTDVERFPEEQTPSVMVVSPGTVDDPAASGTGLYRARWRVDIATQATAGPNRHAGRLARLYTACMRAIAVQHQDEVGLGRRVDWLGELYPRPVPDGDRTVSIGIAQLRVETYDVTDRNTAPVDPEIDPGPDSPTWPLAETHQELIVKWPPQDPFPAGDQYTEQEEPDAQTGR